VGKVPGALGPGDPHPRTRGQQGADRGSRTSEILGTKRPPPAISLAVLVTRSGIIPVVLILERDNEVSAPFPWFGGGEPAQVVGKLCMFANMALKKFSSCWQWPLELAATLGPGCWNFGMLDLQPWRQ
jgi:hypothetical protein